MRYSHELRRFANEVEKIEDQQRDWDIMSEQAIWLMQKITSRVYYITTQEDVKLKNALSDLWRSKTSKS